MVRQIESGAVALGRTKVICLSVLIAALSSVLAGRGAAQTLTTIYSFNGDDGSAPQGGLIVWRNTLYGTTLQGGVDNNSAGVVFALSTDGTGFTNLHTFTGIFISSDGPYQSPDYFHRGPRCTGQHKVAAAGLARYLASTPMARATAYSIASRPFPTILLKQTLMERFQTVAWFCQARRYTGRQRLEAL